MPKATKSVSKKPRKNEDSGCRGSPFLKTGSFLSDTSYAASNCCKLPLAVHVDEPTSARVTRCPLPLKRLRS